MKKLILFVCLALSAHVALYAQSPKIALSKGFPEPESGATRLLQLKNGYTLYFFFTVKEGIRVTVFDETHRQKSSTNLSGKAWEDHDMKNSELKGLFEINGQAVIFLQQDIKHTPFLYRIIVDPKTGREVNEEKIGELPKPGIFSAARYNSKQDFYVEKDPESDYYAVAGFKASEASSDERIEVVHYAPDHKVLNRAFYKQPEDTKAVEYQSMYVHGAEFVFVSTYAYNGSQKDAHIVVSQLLPGSHAFKHQVLNDTKGYKEVLSGVQYNPSNKMLRMLMITRTKELENVQNKIKFGTHDYAVALFDVDPLTLKTGYHGFMEGKSVDNYAKEHLRFKHDYIGMPQDFTINPDGSTTIMLEEIIWKTHNSGTYTGAGGSQMGLGTYYSTEMNDIGIVKVSATGEETGGYAIAKSQELMSAYYFFHHYGANRGHWDFRTNGFGNWDMMPFFSFQYLHPLNNEYILFNDYDKNIRDTAQSYQHKKEVHHVSETNTVCFRRQNDQMTKFFLYGDPGDKDINRYTILEASVHSPDQKQLVTIMVEREGRSSPMAHIAWIDFE